MEAKAFLSRVREAARAGCAYRVATEGDPRQGEGQPPVGYCGAGADPVARLAAEIDLVGGHAQVVDDWGQARAALECLLDQLAPRQALCWRHPVLERVSLAEVLAARGVARLDDESLSQLEPAEQRRRMLDADIGISSATVAIAETGTLAVASGRGQERLASLAPPTHVALVSADQIVPDLFDFFGDGPLAIRPEAMPSNWTLITGPSKTGDLELKLTTGVHGPGAWHVIVVRDFAETKQ
jgi:L-lactate dehydrogenase complex protein LldG